MSPELSKLILEDVQERLQGVMESIKDLPQGYRWKVQEMLSCAETIVSMYHDVQSGTIPDVLTQMREEALNELVPDMVQSTKLDLGDFKID